MPTVDQLNQYLAQSPFNAWLGCRIVRLGPQPGHIEMTLPLRSELKRDGGGVAHGGAVAAFIDAAAHASLHSICGFGMPTIDMKVNYLRLAELPLTAVTNPRRTGRTVGVVDVDVFDAKGRLSAVGRAVLLTQDRGLDARKE